MRNKDSSVARPSKATEDKPREKLCEKETVDNPGEDEVNTGVKEKKEVTQRTTEVHIQPVIKTMSVNAFHVFCVICAHEEMNWNSTKQKKT